MKMNTRSRRALCSAAVIVLSACSQGSSPSVASLVPDAPPGIVAVAGNGRASLFWSPAAITGKSAVTTYTVTSDPGGLTATTTTATTTAILTGLTNGTTYVFTVHATNAHGSGPESPPSNPVVPLGASVPDAPAAVVATGGGNQAVVAWTAPASDGGSAITGYTVTSTPDGISATTTGATTATVAGLMNGTTYVFTVHATNAVGSGPESPPSNAVLPAGAGVPGAPTGVLATAGDAQAVIVWNAPASDGGTTITSYTVTSLPGGVTATATGTTATVLGLTNGASYVFTVRATNNVGSGPESDYSNAIVPVPAAGPPGAPTAVVATAGPSSAALVWTAPAHAGGSAITGYVVTSTPGGLTATTLGATTATVSGLTNGVTYVFTVHATNTTGSGPESGQSNAIIPAASALSATESSFTATPASPFVGDATVVQLHLADEYGNPEVGWPALLSVTGAGASLTVTSGVTNAQGNFSSVLTMPGTGFATVSVEAPGLALETVVRFAPLLVCSASAPGFVEQLTGTSSYPSSIVIGDFNRDGLPDLVATNENNSNVGVLLGNGDGTFKAGVTYVTGLKSTPAGVATADLNGDRLLDLAVAETGTGKIGILLGNGDGSFRTQVTYPTGTGSSPVSVAIGDFNADGNLDLAVANNGSANVGVLLGNGDGTFLPQVTYPVGALPGQVAVGDFNGDGKPDLAAACRTTLTVAVLFGNGDGTFQPQVYYTTGHGSFPVSLATADFNADGRPDVAVANSGTSTVGIFLGAPDGGLLPQLTNTYSTGTSAYPTAVAIGDFNGDGRSDVAVTNSGSSILGVLLGNGDGTFQAQVAFSTGPSTSPVPLAVGDINGDGRVDLVVGNESTGNVGVFLNTCE